MVPLLTSSWKGLVTSAMPTEVWVVSKSCENSMDIWSLAVRMWLSGAPVTSTLIPGTSCPCTPKVMSDEARRNLEKVNDIMLRDRRG